MNISKFCIRNSEDRCIQCRDHAPKKRVCPLYSLLKKRDPVELYEYFATQTTELRKKVDELEDTIQFIIRHPRTTPNYRS